MSTLGGKKLTGSAASGGGVSGLTSADGGTAIADNVIVRGDGNDGIQGSDVLLADTASNIADISATTGNSLQITGSDASGGDLLLRSTSHATKGIIQIEGTTSAFPALRRRAAGTTDHLELVDAAETGRTGLWLRDLFISAGNTDFTPPVNVQEAGVGLIPTSAILWTSNATDSNQAKDTGLIRNAAGVVRVSDGSTGVGSTLTKVLVEANTAGSGAPNVLTAAESRTAFTNEGATAANYHTLPTAVAGLQFEFVVQDADGMRIVANTDDTIRVIDKVTATAGYIESTTIGSVVRLLAINATEWIATSIHGVWTDGTWTCSDVGNTSP